MPQPQTQTTKKGNHYCHSEAASSLTPSGLQGDKSSFLPRLFPHFPTPWLPLLEQFLEHSLWHRCDELSVRVPALQTCHVPSPTSCAIIRFPSPPCNLYIKLQTSTISWEQGYNVYWLVLIEAIGSTPEKVYWCHFCPWMTPLILMGWCMEGNK